MVDDHQQLLAWGSGVGATATTGTVAAPGSGATITLWSSTGNEVQATQGARYKKLVASLYVSHLSAANGLQFDESVDNTNWRNVASFSIAATTYTKSYVTVSAPYVRVRYVNAANVLTTWEMSVCGDQADRAAP